MIAKNGSFVFVHVPKTAGNTVSTLLAPYCSDEIYSGAPFQDGRERFSVRNAAYPSLHKHSTFAEYSEAMGSAFAGALKIYGVRNPWDRALSMYFSPSSIYARTVRPNPPPDPSSWDRGEFVRMLSGYTPTHEYVRLPGAVSPWRCTDAPIRFEHLEADLTHVFRTLCLPDPPHVPKLNASNHARRQVYYDSELTNMVRVLESPVIEAFGYEP